MRNVIRSRPQGVIVLALGLSVLAIVNIIIVAVGLTRLHGAANGGVSSPSLLRHSHC